MKAFQLVQYVMSWICSLTSKSFMHSVLYCLILKLAFVYLLLNNNLWTCMQLILLLCVCVNVSLIHWCFFYSHTLISAYISIIIVLIHLSLLFSCINIAVLAHNSLCRGIHTILYQCPHTLLLLSSCIIQLQVDNLFINLTRHDNSLTHVLLILEYQTIEQCRPVHFLWLVQKPGMDLQ